MQLQIFYEKWLVLATFGWFWLLLASFGYFWLFGYF
jgi:hypothetical protein